MATYSIINIQFTAELTVGQQVGFDIYATNTIGLPPSSYSIVENVVTTRSGSYQMTAATASTGIVGEATAIKYQAAITADLSGYTITRSGNTVTIRANQSPFGNVNFFHGGIFAPYTNPASVIITEYNDITDFIISNVSYATSSVSPCDYVTVNVTTNGFFGGATATTIYSPFSATNSNNPLSFTWSRNENISIVVTNDAGTTASVNATTPPYLNPADFQFETLYDVLSINHTGATALSLQYSLDGSTWQVGNTFSGVTGSYTAFVKDQYGCSFSSSETYTIDRNDFILSRSPYYITYNAPAADFDYCTLEMYLWTGENTIPALPNYVLTSYKAKSTDDFLWIEVSDYIKSFLDPRLDTTWFSDYAVTVDSTEYSVDDMDLSVDTNYLTITSANSFKEVCWARFILRSYKISLGVGLIVDTIQSPLKVASLGYGFHTEGNNPKPPTNTLVNPADKYSTYHTANFITTIRATASNTNFVIERQPMDTDNQICNNNHREFQIIYLNKYGVWDSMLFNRVSKRSIEVKSESSEFYQYRPDAYSIYAPTTRTSNIDANEEWTLNTDLLNERQNSYMQELIMSDRWYLLNQQDGSLIPVVLDEKKFEEKLAMYEQAKIQWTLKFKAANAKINDIR